MITADQIHRAEAYLHREIPLTRAMAVRVVPDDAGFAIEAPIAPNTNHLGTAFGGSINAVATLAGYTFLWLALEETDAHLMISHSSIRFLRPVRAKIRAVCVASSAAQLVKFRAELAATEKARIRLQVRVEERAELAAHFSATFVARRH